jgi:hypothetical protein
VFRDQTAGRPLAGHPALRGDCDRCLRPPCIWNRGVNRHGHPSPHCERSKSAHHDPGFCVPSQGDNMATARRGTLVPAAATAPDCLLVLREPETCKQVLDIGDSRDWAAASPRGGRCSTPEAATAMPWPLGSATDNAAVPKVGSAAPNWRTSALRGSDSRGWRCPWSSAPRVRRPGSSVLGMPRVAALGRRRCVASLIPYCPRAQARRRMLAVADASVAEAAEVALQQPVVTRRNLLARG